jgi:hypothetical protein
MMVEKTHAEKDSSGGLQFGDSGLPRTETPDKSPDQPNSKSQPECLTLGIGVWGLCRKLPRRLQGYSGDSENYIGVSEHNTGESRL